MHTSEKRYKSWSDVWHVQRGLWIIVLGGVCSAMGLLLSGWYWASPYVQARELAAARARWANRPFREYRLIVQQDSHVLIPANVAGNYAVRDEGLDIRQQGVHQRSVTSYFDWIARYPASVEFDCHEFNYHCTRTITYQVNVTYDEQLGYPRVIELTRTRHPDWHNPRFWRWLWQSGSWQECENLLCTTSDSTTIRMRTRRAAP